MSNRNRNRFPASPERTAFTIDPEAPTETPATDDLASEVVSEETAKTPEPAPAPQREMSPRELLAQKQEAREKVLAERARKAEEDRVARQLRELDALTQAESDHGADNVRLVQTTLGGVIVKKPEAVRFEKFQDKARPRTQDFKALLYPCVVYPSVDYVESLLKEYPASLAKLCTAVCELAGMNTKEVEGE